MEDVHDVHLVMMIQKKLSLLSARVKPSHSHKFAWIPTTEAKKETKDPRDVDSIEEDAMEGW